MDIDTDNITSTAQPAFEMTYDKTAVQTIHVTVMSLKNAPFF